MTTPDLPSIKSSAAALWQPLRAAQPPIIYRETRPDQASPALVAQLTGRRQPWIAVLLGLAQRDWVRVEAKPSPQGVVSHTLHRQTVASLGLTPCEKLALEAIFQESDDVPAAVIAPRLAWQVAPLTELLESELIAVGWLDPARHQERERRLALSVKSALVGATMLIGGLVVGAAGFPPPASLGVEIALVLCGAAGLVVSLAAAGLGLAFSPLSAQGEMAAAQWKGFGLFLKQAVQGQKPAPEPFEAYLPLAVALGLVKDINLPQPSLPPWFSVLATVHETGDWGAKLAELTVAAAEPGDAPLTNSGS